MTDRPHSPVVQTALDHLAHDGLGGLSDESLATLREALRATLGNDDSFKAAVLGLAQLAQFLGRGAARPEAAASLWELLREFETAAAVHLATTDVGDAGSERARKWSAMTAAPAASSGDENDAPTMSLLDLRRR